MKTPIMFVIFKFLPDNRRAKAGFENARQATPENGRPILHSTPTWWKPAVAAGSCGPHSPVCHGYDGQPYTKTAGPIRFQLYVIHAGLRRYLLLKHYYPLRMVDVLAEGCYPKGETAQ